MKKGFQCPTGAFFIAFRERFAFAPSRGCGSRQLVVIILSFIVFTMLAPFGLGTELIQKVPVGPR